MNRRKIFRFPVTTLAGSTISNIISHLKNHKIQKRYYPKFVLTFIVALFFEIFNFWEKKRWDKKIGEYKMKASPVFIIGFWRSGTTLLHNLMCLDEKVGYTTTLQTVFPHIVLSQKRWLKRVINFMVPSERPFDKVKIDMDYPQEEEYGLTNVNTQSLYNFFLFPGDFEDIVKESVNFQNKEHDILEKWKKQYKYFLTKSMLNTGGTRYVGKNPCNLFRINILKEIFPDARFIFIHRSPYQVVESLYRFILSVFPGIQLQDVPEDYSREKIVLLYRDVIDIYFKNRAFLHPNDLIEVRMDDLLKDKIDTLRKIYKRFNLCGFDKALPRFEKYMNDNPSDGRHFYSLHPETIRLVNLHATCIVKRLGYNLQELPKEESEPAPAL